MPEKEWTHKPGADNSVQKGLRREKLHKNQNNAGDPKNEPEYENWDGKPIK